MKRTLISILVMVLLFGLTPGIALALPLTATETLNQFNLVVLGNATSSSHVDGRAYIGGDLTGGSYVQHPGNTPTSSYAGLTVGGSADNNVMVNGDGAVVEGNLGGSTINSGNAVVLGTATNSSFNGGYRYYIGANGGGNNLNDSPDASLKNGQAAQAATSTDFGSVLTGLSNQLKGLTSNSSIAISSNTATFNAMPDSNGVAVFDLSAADLQQGQFQFNLNGATTVILNGGGNIDINANFLSGQAQQIGAETIWNFYNATDVNIHNQFGGSILAPNAHFTNQNNIEGGVYADTLDQGGEIHLQPFSGNIPSSPVPEPSTVYLLGVGLLGMIAVGGKLRTHG